MTNALKNKVNKIIAEADKKHRYPMGETFHHYGKDYRVTYTFDYSANGERTNEEINVIEINPDSLFSDIIATIPVK